MAHWQKDEIEEYHPIEKCKTCERYDHVNHKMMNKLRCMTGCDEYMLDQSIRAYNYNRVVSGENFDTEVMYEHGKKVFGSGWKQTNATR